MLTDENIEAVEGVVSQLHPPSQHRMVQDFRRFAMFCGIVGSLLSVVHAPVSMLRACARHTALDFPELYCVLLSHPAFQCRNYTSLFPCLTKPLFNMGLATQVENKIMIFNKNKTPLLLAPLHVPCPQPFFELKEVNSGDLMILLQGPHE